MYHRSYQEWRHGVFGMFIYISYFLLKLHIDSQWFGDISKRDSYCSPPSSCIAVRSAEYECPQCRDGEAIHNGSRPWPASRLVVFAWHSGRRRKCITMRMATYWLWYRAPHGISKIRSSGELLSTFTSAIARALGRYFRKILKRYLYRLSHSWHAW